VTGS
jgi:hypothetical protein